MAMIPKLPQPIDEDAETAARRDEIMQALGAFISFNRLMRTPIANQ